MTGGQHKNNLGAAACVAALLVVALPCSSPAQGKKVSKADGDSACSSYVAAVSMGDEDLYPRDMPTWKYNCEHHPDKAQCENANATLLRLKPQSSRLKCQP